MNVKRLLIRITIIIFITLLAIKYLSGPQVRELKQFRVYDKNGNIWIKRFVKYGDHGEFDVHYDENGQTINGSCFNYHSGYKVRRIGWCKDGKFNGQVLGYEKGNNRLVVEGYYKDGLRDGFFKVYDKGRLDRIHNFKMGKLHGRQRDYYEDGNVHCDGFYRRHVKTKEFKCYYEDGLLEEIGEYKNGLREGTHWRWRRDGTLQWEMEFKNGWEAKHNETYTVKSVISGDTILLDNNKRVRLKGIEEKDNIGDTLGLTPRQILKDILKKGSRYVDVRLEFDGERNEGEDWEAYVFVDTGYTRDTFPYIEKWPGDKDAYVDYFPIRLSYFINAIMIKKKAVIVDSDQGKYAELLENLSDSQ